MKIRNGFVSNSSSSSFLIIDKSSSDVNAVSFIDIIKNIKSNDYCEETRLRAVGYDDVWKYHLNEYYCGKEEDFENENPWVYKMLKNEIAEAFKDRLVYFDIAYGDSLYDVLKVFEKKGLVEVLIEG